MQRQSVDRKELARLVAATGVEVPQTALEPLAEYLEMLCQWNKAMNLVGPHTWQDMLARLVVDSFHLAAFLDKLALAEAPLCWDLGAGAGDLGPHVGEVGRGAHGVGEGLGLDHELGKLDVVECARAVGQLHAGLQRGVALAGAWRFPFTRGLVLAFHRKRLAAHAPRTGKVRMVLA